MLIDERYWLHCCRPIVPRTTIVGYVVYCLVELFIVVTYYSAYCCNITFFISSCLYLEALCVDFEQMCYENDKLNMGSSNVLEKKERLIDVISFQSKIHMYDTDHGRNKYLIHQATIFLNCFQNFQPIENCFECHFAFNLSYRCRIYFVFIFSSGRRDRKLRYKFCGDVGTYDRCNTCRFSILLFCIASFGQVEPDRVNHLFHELVFIADRATKIHSFHDWICAKWSHFSWNGYAFVFTRDFRAGKVKISSNKTIKINSWEKYFI